MWDLSVCSIKISQGLDFQLICVVRSVHILRSSWVFTGFFFTQLPCRMWETTSNRQQINMQECEGHASVHSPVCSFGWRLRDSNEEKRGEFFYTLILNEDDRYFPKELPPGLSLYLMSRNDFAVGTVHCFLQQNKSFSFDLQHTLEPIIGVQNWFKWYAQLNILIAIHMLLRLLKRNTKFQLNRSLVI